MAASAMISGGARISAGVSTFAVSPFSGSFSLSSFFVDQFILAAGVSEFVVSVQTVSNPSFVVLKATEVVRVNFGNLPSSTSHASAGFQFADIFAQVGCGISGPLALHFANSGSNSATITVMLGQVG